MKLLSLFSGIGAFEKALDNLEIPYELVAYCEIDKYASKSYSAINNVPESMNLGDITKVDEKQLPKDIDLVTYGFPCQDISLAGKQKGLFNEDGSQTRSGLFFEALRIIEETQPRVAIAENVKNLVGKKFKEQFKIVLDSLEQAGYNNYWKVLNSRDFGIPQNRERVFIISIRKDIDTGFFKFPEGFPLELRLKDMLDDVVDEKYYLGEKGLSLIERQQKTRLDKTTKESNLTLVQLAHGFNPGCEMDADLFPTLTQGSAMHWHTLLKENEQTEPIVKQIGNCCPTKTRENPNQGRVYDQEGISPSLNCMEGGNRQPCIVVKTNNSKGYDIAEPGDYINIERPNSTTRRGRVGHGVSQCLDTKENHCAVVQSEPRIDVIGNYSPSGHDASRIVNPDGLEPTVKENHGTVTATMQNSRIRKLTPKECFRLQGFDDESFHRAEAVNSNTQLYKQAGNSITVQVVEHLIKQLKDCGAL